MLRQDVSIGSRTSRGFCWLFSVILGSTDRDGRSWGLTLDELASAIEGRNNLIFRNDAIDCNTRSCILACPVGLDIFDRGRRVVAECD